MQKKKVTIEELQQQIEELKKQIERPTKTRRVPYSSVMPEQQWLRLNAAAQQTMRKKTELINEAVEAWLTSKGF